MVVVHRDRDIGHVRRTRAGGPGALHGRLPGVPVVCVFGRLRSGITVAHRHAASDERRRSVPGDDSVLHGAAVQGRRLRGFRVVRVLCARARSLRRHGNADALRYENAGIRWRGLPGYVEVVRRTAVPRGGLPDVRVGRVLGDVRQRDADAIGHEAAGQRRQGVPEPEPGVQHAAVLLIAQLHQNIWILNLVTRRTRWDIIIISSCCCGEGAQGG